MTMIESIDYKDYRIEIHYDTDAYNPRQDDNFGTLYAPHRDYILSDKNVTEGPSKTDVKLPVYLYDHSGISISTEHVYPYNDRWDAGHVGWIYVTREKIKREYGEITSKTISLALNVMKSEIETFDAYLRGECYGYIIYNPDNVEEEDSCWGYYSDDDCVSDAKNVIDYLIAKSEVGKEQYWDELLEIL